MFDELLDANGLREALMTNCKFNNMDFTFIKELMIGQPIGDSINGDGWPFAGRGEEKAFLYEIVANKNTGY